MNNQEVIKSAFMLKRSQMRSKFKTENYKSRWFQLTATVLRYCDGTIENGVGKVKGQIELSQVTAVENTDSDVLGNRPNAFQVVYKAGYPTLDEMCTLYIIAVFEQQKIEWIDAIRQACSNCGCEFSARYHPGIWLMKEAKYSCCESINKRTAGCQHATCPFAKAVSKAAKGKNAATKPVPAERNSPANSKEESAYGFVLALYDYESTDDTELNIAKGEQYELLETYEEGKWMKVKNNKGMTGLVPASYVKKIGGNMDDLEEFEWYYKSTSRMQSETILIEDGREGCFMVRDSSQRGVYTLSILKKSTANEAPLIKHYHVKRSNPDGCYYLTDKHKFETIPELIYYHKHNSAGLIVRLRFPPSDRMKPVPVPVPDTEEIDISLLKIGEELGSGQFGKVMKGIYKGSIEVAIKSLKEGTMSEDDFIDEAKTMVKLNHTNLVQLYGICRKPILIITEYMKYGALLHYLKRNKICLIKETGKLLDFCIQVSSAMQYLEEHSIIHRDLAARNCLVGDKNVVKVADFGLARHVLDDEYHSSAGAKFPVRWSAPEVLQYTKFSSKSDIWSFGVLMWEIFTCGEMPYLRAKNKEIVESVCNRKMRLPKPAECPSYIYQVMSTCWEQDPEKRPTFSKVNSDLQALVDPDDSD